jgi:dTDP-4-dehydrorhamnose 3,5-epimerase
LKFTQTELPGVILIDPDVHGDQRGFFLETYHARKYREGGIEVDFVQDNHSRSVRGTLRGIHAQLEHSQGKLIRVVEGEVYDVAVDIRRGSPTFGRFAAARLSESNFRQLYIPPGFGHAFCVTSPVAQLEYKCTEFYDPGSEIAILWSDPEIAIPWPLEEPLLSPRDAAAKPLREFWDALPRYRAEER